MKSSENNKKLIERFLNGELDDQEQMEFEHSLSNDSALCEMLEAAASLEGMLHGQDKTLRGRGTFEHIVTESRLSGKAKINQSNHVQWQRLYAIAATLVIIILGGYIVKLTMQQLPVNVARVNESPEHREVKKAAGKTITRITPSTVFLAEEGTRSRILRQDDSSITLMVSQGNICFDVNGPESRPIIVATPHSAITLSQSVTRIVVTELETEVTVLEGTAEVIHRSDRTKSGTLKAGSALFADYTTLTFADALAKNVCDSRKTVFRAYLAWVQKQANS